MHGVLFTAFRHFTWSHLSDDADEIWRGLPNYLMTDAYPDEDFVSLVARACEASGRPRRELLVDFGRFTGFWVFRVMRGDFYEARTGTREFLLEVESQIHETVRATTPNAAPPRLQVTALGDGGVSIAYTSERRMCELVAGLVHGVADYYGERFEINEPSCMQRGDAACSFMVIPA